MGTYQSGGQTEECVPCPVGQYQDREQQLGCTPCPDGLTTVTNGSADPAQCRGSVQDHCSFFNLIVREFVNLPCSHSVWGICKSYMSVCIIFLPLIQWGHTRTGLTTNLSGFDKGCPKFVSPHVFLFLIRVHKLSVEECLDRPY